MRRTGYVFAQRYLLHDPGAWHPERPDRLRAIHRALEAGDLLELLVRLRPDYAPIEWVERLHTPDYIKRFQQACEQGREIFMVADCGICRDSYQTALLAVGGVMLAVEAVMGGQVDNAFCAVRPPGHHAERDRAMGFCFFNNVALGAVYALEHFGLERVAIIDWDVHHGNGTQNIFLEDPTVFYFSIHEHPTFLYPGTGRRWEIGKGKGEGATLNAPMAPGAGDAEYRTTFEQMLEPAVERFRPEIILVSAGFDAHRDDPLADLQVTEEGFRFMTRHLLALADRFCGGKVVSILEGGYETSSLTSCIEIHVRELLGE